MIWFCACVQWRSTVNFSAMSGHQWCKLYIQNVTFFLAPDIDECLTASACHQNATCENTKGSYNCTCKGGLKGDGRINCTGKILLNSFDNTTIFISFIYLLFVSLSSHPKPSHSRILISLKSEFHSSLEKRFSFLEGCSQLSYVYSRIKSLASKETMVPRWRGPEVKH